MFPLVCPCLHLSLPPQGQVEVLQSNLSLRLQGLQDCGDWGDPNMAAVCSVGSGDSVFT